MLQHFRGLLRARDLNSIEDLLSLLKVKVVSGKAQILKDLRRVIYKEWIDLLTELASKLVGSMNNRVNELIQSAGENILY